MEFQLLSSAPGSATVTVFPRQQHKRMSEARIIFRKGKCSQWKSFTLLLALQAQYQPSVGRAKANGFVVYFR